MRRNENSFERYSRRVGTVLLGIADKAVGSSTDGAGREGLRPQQARFLIRLAGVEPPNGGHPRQEGKAGAAAPRRLAKRLARRGLVETARYGRRRGVLIVTPTEAGVEAAARLTRDYVRDVTRALTGTSDKEREALLTLLLLIDETLD